MPNQNTVMSPFNERLSSVPMIPRNKDTDDGVTPMPVPQRPGSTAPVSQAPGADPAMSFAQAQTLETSDDQTTFRCIDQLVRSQDRLARNRWAIDTYFTWIDAGVAFGRLDKIPNQNMWVAKLPPGMGTENVAALPNKVNDLNNKVSEALLVDPPRPNTQAHTNGEGENEAGELATSFLMGNGGESGTNDVSHFRWALRNALPRSSSFLHYEDTEDGGGYQPYQVLAHPQAQDPTHPLVALIPNVQTGIPEPQQTPNPVLRYVSAPSPDAPAGQFVENPSEADKVWLPSIEIKRLRREQVRTFPATATIDEAKATILILWCTLAEGRAKWPSVAEMDAGQLANLASWRPVTSDLVVPYTFKALADGMTGPTVDEVGNFSPLLQRRMFYYRMYIAADKQEYQNGLTIDISGLGGGTILDRQTLDYEMPTDDGKTELKCRDIPLVQITPVQDTIDNDPMGWSFDFRFAGSTEATAQIYSTYLDALERILRPHVFIYSTTPVDELDWDDRTKPVILNPGDPPVTYENIPQTPDIVRVAEDMRQQQNTASGLSDTAQGLEVSSSVSGVAKQLTVQQAKVSLSGMHQQLMNAFTRGWRLKIQIAQAKFKTPQLLQYPGSGASSQVKWFRGEDLAGVDDIGIEPGTGTLETPEGKANSVAFLQQQGWLQPDQAADVAVLGIARELGLPQDATTEAIDRAVSFWLKGPDPQWVAQIQQYQQQMQAAQQQIQQAQQTQAAHGMQPSAPPQPPPPPAPPVNPFAPKPNDNEPMVAQKWVKRLSRLMMSPEYDQQPPEWQALLNQKYLTCRSAATVQPPQNQADATYQQFVQDVNTKVLQMSNQFVAKEVAIGAGLAPAPAPPGQQNGPPSDKAA